MILRNNKTHKYDASCQHAANYKPNNNARELIRLATLGGDLEEEEEEEGRLREIAQGRGEMRLGIDR